MKQLKGIKELLMEEEGMGTVEIILIIVVLVGLVIIFKSQITQIINSLFQKITSQTGTV
nr:Flp1 family type IVb pilin [uncultured Acetatifactor sp.]